jgi:flagellar motor switch protein FliN/FliY
MGEEVDMENQTTRNAARSFAVDFAAAVQAALAAAMGSPWPLNVLDTEDAPTRKATPVQFRIRAHGDVQGEFFVEFYEPPFSQMAARLLGGRADATEQEHISAAVNVLSLAMPVLAISLAQRFGQITFNVESVAGLAFGGMLVVPLAAPADEESAPVLLYFDAQLLNSLSKTTPGKGSAKEAAVQGFNAGNLKLVMDVELNVCLRFGQRQLPLREVLELTSGSVVELDRMVDEPVELLLDGKVVARGEAVIVDGNYGLRVTEVPHSVESILA